MWYCHSHDDYKFLRVSYRLFNGFPVVNSVVNAVEGCFVALNYYENGSVVGVRM
jgi:hypothetical protein